jgi:CRP-like cAMP-binding protein
VARGGNSKIDLIKRVPLFSKLSKARLNEVATIADEIDLPKGKQLTREGERGREFFVLIEGEAEVRKGGRRVNTLGPGDFLGEISLITKVPRTATVTTSGPTRALVITDRAFAQLIRESPEISHGVLEAVGERLAAELS